MCVLDMPGAGAPNRAQACNAGAPYHAQRFAHSESPEQLQPHVALAPPGSPLVAGGWPALKPSVTLRQTKPNYMLGLTTSQVARLIGLLLVFANQKIFHIVRDAEFVVPLRNKSRKV